jgi:anti-repressor protein
MGELAITEYNDIRVLTTQQLAECYGTDSKTISYNFNHNKDRYIEGKHYVCLTGDDLRAFRENHDLPSNINKVYLWTEKGTFLHAKSLNTDSAWEVYDRLIETYFTVKKELIDKKQLSPQLQLMNMLVENMNKAEIEQKRQAEQINKVEQTIDNMKEIFTQPIGDWKAEINSRVREISIKSNIDYQTLYNQLYGELETTAHCSLKRLQDNKKKRMEKAGNTKTAIKNETTKIAIISENPQLKAIFENIVRKYAMSYCA